MTENETSLYHGKHELNTRFFIERINKIIEEAVTHGGDSGGAYHSNTYDLIQAMRDFLRWTGLEKTVGIMNCDGDIKFYLKQDIVTEE